MSNGPKVSPVAGAVGKATRIDLQKELQRPDVVVPLRTPITTQPVLRFEIGGYYKHPTNSVIHIVGAVPTTMYGWCLVAEGQGSDQLHPIGQHEGATDNWEVATEVEWMAGFSE